jgi:hypothetical protein
MKPTPTHAPPIWHSNNPPHFAYADFNSTYWDFYPRGEDLVMEAVYPLEGGTGLEIHLKSEREDVSHFLAQINEGPVEEIRDGILRVEFDDNHTLEKHSSETRVASIRAVSEGGSESEPYTIRLSFAPKERYLANGHVTNAHSRIQIQQSDVKLFRTAVQDWLLDDPTEEEREYAQNKWGALVQPGRPVFENARAIGKALLDDLNPHRGTPSDEMGKLKPFGQYERLVAGKDHCWCANLAEIFSYACNALDIPARFIIMRHQLFPPPEDINQGYEVMLAGGHTTMEIFDAVTGQWNWIDLTYNALGAYLGDEGPLNMMELHRYLNEPARLKRLGVDFYDSETRTVNRIPVVESEKLPNFLNCFKQDQLFRYMRRPD